jgi:signal transduction histidine kinase
LRARLSQPWGEWGFVALLAGFCLILSVLQYRWTGELSRAEAQRLRAGINEQAQQFCRTFDATLSDTCQALIPRDETLNDSNRETIHAACFQKWKATNPRPLFDRVAVAVSTPEGPQLFGQSLVDGQLAPMSWPAAWDSVRQFLSPKSRMGPRAFERPNGTLFLFPAGGRPGRNNSPDTDLPLGDDGPHDEGNPPRGRGEGRFSEWMLFELDSNYLAQVWLPELTRRYLNPDAQSLNDVEVKSVPPPGRVIFTTGGGGLNLSGAPVKLPLNRQGRDPEDQHGPGGDFCWELEVRPHPGTLEAIVAASHRRNLSVSFLLNGLIFAAALALAHQTRRSRKLAEAQMNFVATVSHELRTPLTVIRGAGHNLLRGVAREPAQIEQYSRLIIQHAEQLTDMVEQILQLAGAKRSSAAAGAEPVAIADLLRAAAAATSQETQAAHCQVQLELPPSLPAIAGDAPALRRAFQNLIANAAKHGGSGGWIGITAASVAGGKSPQVEVRVADRGPGIPEAEVAEVFKPFFRGAIAQQRQIRGSGLGLSLVKETVQAHGGTVRVESQPGQGAVFVVRLPAANPGIN